MEATVRIDGKDVRFKATAAVPMLYRRKFGRDLMRDIRGAATADDDAAGDLSVETIERMAYIMARHADPEAVPDSLEEWVDDLPPMAIYSMIPVIMGLWTGNVACLEEAKKKLEQLTENLPQPSSCSGPSKLESH